jgi:predicted N-acyltransferase
MTFGDVRVLSSLDDVPALSWDALLAPGRTPFERHAFLHALEKSRSASPKSGWTPRHLTLWRAGRLIAAAPAYLKEDSDGDFARDWDWASVAGRSGLPYYPKLCLTIPFTPVTGSRVLVAPGEDRDRCLAALLDGARDLCARERIPTLQVLFPDEAQARELESAGLALRVSHQFHWHNEGYKTSDDFLARFNSKRRHMLKRERGAAAEQGITIRTVRAPELNDTWARAAYALHRSTVDKLMWGRRWLNEDFYRRIFASMPEDLEVVAAEKDGRLIAGAFNVHTPTHLYGRYWGCFEEHPFLHFNVCLYHSIDECIRRGVQVFEGGAGGEHKLPRGFMPAVTWSAHASLDRRLDKAMRDFLREETPERRRGIAQFAEQSPIFKRAEAAR